MATSMKCIEYFCKRVFPFAGNSSDWNEDDISKGLKWAKLCQKSYSRLFSKFTPERMDVKTARMDKNEQSSNSLNILNLECMETIHSPSNTKLKKLSMVMQVCNCSTNDIQNAVFVYCSKLLLNAHVMKMHGEFLRNIISETLSELEKKELWLLVDQINLNKENIEYKLSDFEKSNSTRLCEVMTEYDYNIVMLGEVKQRLLANINCDRMENWLEYQIKENTKSIITKNKRKSVKYNMLSNLLFVCTELQKNECYFPYVLKLLCWITNVHINDLHDCHEHLMVQWLTLTKYSGKCICKVLSKVLVSLLQTFYRLTSKETSKESIALSKEYTQEFEVNIAKVSSMLRILLDCDYKPVLDITEDSEIKESHQYLRNSINEALSIFVTSDRPWHWHRIYISTMMNAPL